MGEVKRKQKTFFWLDEKVRVNIRKKNELSHKIHFKTS